MQVFETFFILNAFHCAVLAFCSRVENTIIFVATFLLDLLIINLSFVANFVILHIQHFLVITNRDFYSLPIMVDKF